ncbi:GAF and ANTAR domain-containing protein [Geodermatophilus sp. SYSU D00758]
MPDEPMIPAGPGDEPTAGPAMQPEQAFAELGRIPLGDLQLGQVLQRVATLAGATVPGAEQVSVTLVEDGRASSVAFTGSLAAQLDERQYDKGFGPCLDAALSGTTVVLTDLDNEQRYPDFAAVARRAGVTAAASVGMPVPSRTVGGINVYSLNGRGLDEESVRVAEVFASYAAVAVANAGLLHSTAQLAESMRRAMDTRATIEQAKGILVARTGCTPEQTFDFLVSQSQKTNRKLRDLAAELVAEAQRDRRD